MDNPWWSSGAFTIVGGVLAWLGSRLNVNKERQARLQDTRREVYSRFIATCRRVAFVVPVKVSFELSDLLSEIELLSTAGSVVEQARDVVLEIIRLSGKQASSDDIVTLREMLFAFSEEAKLELGVKKRAGHPKAPGPSKPTST